MVTVKVKVCNTCERVGVDTREWVIGKVGEEPSVVDLCKDDEQPLVALLGTVEGAETQEDPPAQSGAAEGRTRPRRGARVVKTVEQIEAEKRQSTRR